MRSTTVLCLAIAAAAFAGPANAIFKCTTAKGVVYQDRPCREGNEADVRIVVPTGELAPKATATADDAAPANAPRAEEQTRSVKPVRYSADGPGKVAAPGERQASDDGSSRQTKPASTAERTVPMTADQASKSDPSAKYYATEAFGTGDGTPTQMNCESPSGEKRVFYLSNGKLMSI
jgi:hypothetical protein